MVYKKDGVAETDMKFGLFFLLCLLFVLLVGCGKKSQEVQQSTQVPVIEAPIPVPVVEECVSNGLADTDLSGNRRACPNATMGALEASNG